MANQLFGTNYEYSVLDNAAAPTFPTLNVNSHIGYDTVSVVPGLGAAVGQDQNLFTNGTLPDAVNKATAISTGLILTNLHYRNPA